MEEILNRLISLIPVILAIIWVIRLIERVRRRGKAARQTVSSGPKRTRTSALRPGKSVTEGVGTLLRPGESSKLVLNRGSTFPKTRQVAETANRAKKTVLLDSLLSPAGGTGSDKLDRLSRKKPIIVPDNREPGVRVVEDRAASIETPAGRSSLDSIRARSPLAQAMLWKIILGRPSALKEPGE